MRIKEHLLKNGCAVLLSRLMSMGRKSQRKQQCPGKRGRTQVEVIQEVPSSKRLALTSRCKWPACTCAANAYPFSYPTRLLRGLGFGGREETVCGVWESTWKLHSKKKIMSRCITTNKQHVSFSGHSGSWAALLGYRTFKWFSECWCQGRGKEDFLLADTYSFSCLVSFKLN